MTEINLDKLAALAPFTQADMAGVVRTDYLAAALNEWADLRAYKQRTEAALASLADWIRDRRDIARMAQVEDVARDLDLWRDPAPKEASDG